MKDVNAFNLYILKGRGPLVPIETYVDEQARRFKYNSYSDMRADGYDISFPEFFYKEDGSKTFATKDAIDYILKLKGVLPPTN